MNHPTNQSIYMHQHDLPPPSSDSAKNRKGCDQVHELLFSYSTPTLFLSLLQLQLCLTQHLVTTATTLLELLLRKRVQ